MTKTDHVRARFGGRDLVFKIERLDMGRFEKSINYPAITVFQRTVDGRWTAGDVAFVLNWAAPGQLGKQPVSADGQDPLLSGLFERHALLERARILRGEKPSKTFVDKTIEQNGIAVYAVLAQGILAAALYGIPDEAADFSDEEVEAVDDPA